MPDTGTGSGPKLGTVSDSKPLSPQPSVSPASAVQTANSQMPGTQVQAAGSQPETAKQGSDESKEKELMPSQGSTATKPTPPSTPEKKEKAKGESLPETQSARAINLLPQLTKREREIIDKKVNFSLSGAFFFILMAGAAVVILGLNLLFKQQLASANTELANTENKIREYSSIELRARTLAFKLNTYKSIRGRLFKNDQVLGELERLAPEDIEIKTYSMTTDPGVLGNESEMEFFQVSGIATSVRSISEYAYALESDGQYEQVIVSLVQKRTAEEIEEEQDGGGQTIYLTDEKEEETPEEYNFTISLLAKNLSSESTDETTNY